MFGAKAEVNKTRMSGAVQVGIRYVPTLITHCQCMHPTETNVVNPHKVRVRLVHLHALYP